MELTRLGLFTDEAAVVTIQEVPPAAVTKQVVVYEATVSGKSQFWLLI